MAAEDEELPRMAEEGLNDYLQQLKKLDGQETRKKEYAESFKRMNDLEQKCLSEAGLGELLRKLDDYEKS